MPKYTLIYFNGRGRAELSRLIFTAAGQVFEDVRLEQSEWPKLKPGTPFKSLPLLKVDDEEVGQSAAVARYLARELGLTGKTSLDQSKVDAIHETTTDAGAPLGDIMFCQDKKKKAELVKSFEEKKGPESLAILEALLCANKDGQGFFVGDRLTYADLAFFNFAQAATEVTKVTLDKYPKLKGLFGRVKETPNIAKYLKKRPKTAF